MADLAQYDTMLARLLAGAAVDPAASALVDQAVATSSRPGFDTLMCLPRLRFEPFAYQLSAAETVLRRMRGRAILADEVGLGKTIEAGLVLSELRLRGLAARSLLVVPPGLLEQWQEELDRKFALPSLVVSGAVSLPEKGEGWPLLLVSLPTARRSGLRERLAAIRWDLVVVDEAHRVRQPQSASGRLVRSLATRSLLLLTATPVENRLDDVFQLVSLVQPGRLGTAREFRQHHGGARSPGTAGPGTELARDLPGLRRVLREVMVRHRRSEVALMLPRRLAETVRVQPSRDEAALYATVSDRVRREGRDAPPARVLALRAVQRLAGSSPRALAPTLDKVGWHDLAEVARAQPFPAKAGALATRLRRHLGEGSKVVVFTAFRETLADLVEMSTGYGFPAVAYHGGLSRREKEGAIAAFRDEVPVLLTTEAAGEGRNLQFCHVMVNFDLPWNPMQIEQRLGRIHRIGQDHDVLVTNLVAAGTIEDRVLAVLEAKLNLFELVVGELDMVLGRVGDELDFEASVFSAHLGSADDEELGARLDALGDELASARSCYLESRARTDALVATDDEPARP
ncbi:MAG: DEAD/DEAH box helicase [Acidimicrobiales bacterium]